MRRPRSRLLSCFAAPARPKASAGFVQHVSGAYAQDDPLEHAVRTMGTASSSATLLGMSAGTPATYVVRLAPREGLSETRYYDASTYLLQKIEIQDYDGRTRISQNGDYRKVAGRMVPFLRTYVSVPTTQLSEADPVRTIAFDRRS